MSDHHAILAKILELPGNRSAYDRVRERLVTRQATAFVGAGASTPLYPLWGQLITAMADAAVNQAGATAADRDFWVQNAAAEPLQMVRQIRQRLQAPRYFAFLYDTFKLKTGPDGQGFTNTHRALLALNFKAFMTTNYDEGLVQARHVVRSGLRDTGFVVWNQNFPVNRWLSGDAQEADGCPILFAHGHHADPENLVLDRDSYRRAYHDTPYGRLVRELWHREHLVFAGFSFKDEVLKQIADQDLWETVRQGGGAPRHVAILGLDGDVAFSPEMRRLYEDQFFADVLFYPVDKDADGGPNHGALAVVLDALAADGGRRQVASSAVVAPVETASQANARSLRSRFVHETTEDEKFTGREMPLSRLDDWVTDPNVSIVAISAIGGTGKTALLATWLRREKTTRARPFEAVFFWSFYRNTQARAFLQSLLDFGRAELSWAGTADDQRPLVDQAMELVRQVPVLLGLDGLEVIQEDPGGLDYGKVLDHDLAEFLDHLAYAPTPSFVVLTSRYPFPDLTPFLGGALRLLPLSALEPADGARLLASMGVRGDGAARAAVSERLEGHPLALRLFARSMPADLRGDPDRHWDVVFAAAALEAGDPMAAKMGRLLNFYGDHLPSERREALGLVALFRTPTAESTLLPLWHEILGRTGEEPSLQGCLRGLHADHLLTADVGDDGVARYAAHPILRDYFRALLLGREGFAKSASAVLSLRPGSGQDRLPEADEIRFVVVELLLLQGEVRAAMDTLPETAELNFRRLAQVSRASLEAVERFGDRLEANAIYDMLVGFLALTEMSFRNLGEPVQNEEVQRRFVSRLEERLSVSDREVIALMRLAMSGASRLAAGDPTSITALSRATEHLDNSNPLRRIFSLVAWGLTGNLETTEAPTSATQAKTNFATIQLFVGGLSAFAIEALIKAKELAAARWAADQLYAALQSADRWTSNAAVAEYLTAWLALVERDYQGAHKSIDKAKPVFLRAPMVYDLAKLHLVEARLGLAEGNVEASFVAANAALRIAAPRRYRLIHADALNLRASSWLARAPANVVAARDDAEAALHLAETSHYRWAERDACESLALAYAQLGQAAEAARYQKRFDTLKKELVLPPGFSIIPETAPHERNAETSG